MTRTVIALYDDFAAANATVRELVDNGFPRDDISLMANDASGDYGRHLTTTGTPVEAESASGAAQGAGVGAGIGAVIGGLGGLLIGLGALTIPGIGPVLAAGPLAAALTGLAGAGAGAVAGGVTGGLLGALMDMGVPEETAGYYAEGVRRGGTLLSVRSPEHMTDRAVEILNRHDPVDINERVGQWRQAGWAGFDQNAAPYQPSTSTTTRDQDMVMGASTSEHGDTFPADSQFRRQASVGSEASTTPQRDIDTDYASFDTYDNDFRNHFTTSYAGTGYTYEQYQPAYRYGYDLATNTRYHGRDWTDVEPEARRYWDERNPGTWEQIKGAVQHAWDEIRDAVS